MVYLRVWVISDPWQDADDDWMSPIEEDYGAVYTPNVATGLTWAQAKAAYGWSGSGVIPVGRDDATPPQIVYADISSAPTYHAVVTTEGVHKWGALLMTIPPETPALCVVDAKCDSDVAATIHASTGSETGKQYLVLAADLEDQADTPPAWLEDWLPDTPFVQHSRWSQLRTGLIARGVPSEVIDNWATSNPDGTPRQFFKALKSYVEG